MRGRLKQTLKRGLIKLGERCPEALSHNAQAALNYLEVGRWMKSRGYLTYQRCASRLDVFNAALPELAGRKTLYLEFGVAEGESMQYWSQSLRHPEARLHGFDSFEGLPSNWNASHKKGTFSTGGEVPVFDDPRITLFKGWFEDTLPTYELPEHDVLFANLDADLYSSTAVALKALRTSLKPGDFVYFDEFAQPFDEMRAFEEFVDGATTQMQLMAATPDLVHVLFQCL